MSSAASGFEMGPMVLLHDGRVMLMSSTGQTAFYDTHTGIWSKGPDEPIVNVNGIPTQMTTEDTPAAVMPNGKVLVVMSPGGAVPTPPSFVFEFDPSTNVVDVCIQRIRKKIAAIGVTADGESPVESVRGVGYRFRKLT